MKYGDDWTKVANLFDDKSAEQCKERYDELMAAEAEKEAQASVPIPAAQSIIPVTGISQLAKLLFVTAKLYSRNLLSQEERRILKQLAVRRDANLFSIDLSSDSFLTQLIDTASSIAITAASNTFHSFLYRHCSTNHGKTLSKNERKAKQITDNSFVYGEIDFHSFASILREIRPLLKPDGIFYDLGSGTGRPCFAMALLSDMKQIIGIEYLSDLVEASRSVQEQYENYLESDEVEIESDEEEEQSDAVAAAAKKKRVVHSPLIKLERKQSIGGSSSAPPQKRVSFIQGDFLETDWWSNGDFIFLNSTCYSPPLMQSLSQRAERVRPGAIVVSLTKALQSTQFTLLSKKKYQMSW
jgi:SAM-dependent methyltransferase